MTDEQRAYENWRRENMNNTVTMRDAFEAGIKAGRGEMKEAFLEMYKSDSDLPAPLWAGDLLLEMGVELPDTDGDEPPEVTK